MDRPETISLLRRAHDEIVQLRRANVELAPKAHAYDTLASFARLADPPRSQGYGEDVAWRLKEVIDKMDDERRAAGEEPTP